jgi:hypothetical protein
MPPEENNPIPKDERQIIVKHLKEMLEVAVKSKEEVVVAPIRRMTRFQYANAVKIY